MIVKYMKDAWSDCCKAKVIENTEEGNWTCDKCGKELMRRGLKNSKLLNNEEANNERPEETAGTS